jgi:hypothetical protein
MAAGVRTTAELLETLRGQLDQHPGIRAEVSRQPDSSWLLSAFEE